MSEKFDGVRVFWTGRKLITRQGHPIHAPSWFTESLPGQALDVSSRFPESNLQKL